MQNAPKLDREILVPFCPESVLSGIHYLDFMNAVWYRRSLQAGRTFQRKPGAAAL